MITLERAYKWLDRFDDKKTEISRPLELLMDQMNNALRLNLAADVARFSGRLVYLCDRLGNKLQAGFVRVECARALFITNDLDGAHKLLDEALEKLNDHKHNKALVYWMQGFVLWHLPGRQDDAIYAWQRSSDLFRELIDWKSSYGDKAAWYSQKNAEMSLCLRQAIQSNGLTALAWDDYPLLTSIPIGGFDLQQIDVIKTGDVAVRNFFNPSHFMQALEAGPQPYILQVSGDSMDQAGIANGDYALVSHQNTANHKDIVAAEVTGSGSPASLYRFLQEGGKIILQPESTNPVHRKLEFLRMNDGFQIRAVVIAVSKT